MKIDSALKIILLLVFVSAVQSQTRPIIPSPSPMEPREFQVQRMALMLERQGDFEGALNYYFQLREIDPVKEIYIQGVTRCLIALERFQQAVDTLAAAISRIPKFGEGLRQRANLLLELGNVYLEWGKTEEAWGEWKRALELNGNDANLYRRISVWLMNRRMVDKAVEILKIGDARLEQETLAIDIGRCYTALMDYQSAVDYYLKFLEAQPRQSYIVEQQIYSFPNDEKTVEAVISALRMSENPEAARILGGYLFSLGRYREALELTLANEPQAQDLLNFASQLEKEKEYSLAKEAYFAVSERFSEPQYEAAVMAGLAECSYRLGDGVSAMEYFRILNAGFSRSRFAENALYRMGEIQLEYFLRPDSAEYFFQQLILRFPQGGQRYQASLRHASCAVRRGELETARGRLLELLKILPLKIADTHAEALLLLGKVYFWEGAVDSASAVWGQLTAKFPMSETANDALKYILLIKKTQNKAILESYSQAWLALERKQYSAAEVSFRELAEKYTGSPVGGNAALNAAEAAIGAGDIIRGLAKLEDLLELHPEQSFGGLRDEMLFFLAEKCLDKLGDSDKAAHFYRKLLLEESQSALAPLARKKLEKLNTESEEYKPGVKVFSS